MFLHTKYRGPCKRTHVVHSSFNIFFISHLPRKCTGISQTSLYPLSLPLTCSVTHDRSSLSIPPRALHSHPITQHTVFRILERRCRRRHTIIKLRETSRVRRSVQLVPLSLAYGVHIHTYIHT